MLDETWKCFSIYDKRKRNVLIELERFKPMSEIFGIATDNPASALGTIAAAGGSQAYDYVMSMP